MNLNSSHTHEDDNHTFIDKYKHSNYGTAGSGQQVADDGEQENLVKTTKLRTSTILVIGLGLLFLILILAIGLGIFVLVETNKVNQGNGSLVNSNLNP